MEILDQESNPKSTQSITKSRLLNSFVVLLFVLFLIYAACRVISDYFYYKSSYRVLLPSDTFIYESLSLVNGAIILCVGLIPIIYFRIKGMYRSSLGSALFFSIIALILRNKIELYKVLYYLI